MPLIEMSCKDSVEEGDPATFNLSILGGLPTGKLKFIWSLSSGKILKGRGHPSITVDTNGLAGEKITATVEILGLDPAVNRIAQCTTEVRKRP